MDFRKSRRLMWIGYVIGIFIVALGSSYENQKFAISFAIAGIVIFVAATLQAFIFYICPHCGYSLMNVRGEIPEHCPKCGKGLKE